MSFEYPVIDGQPTSWANLKVSLEAIGGPTFSTADFAALDFDETLEPSKVPGTGPMHRGMTVGMYDANGSMSMYQDRGTEFLRVLQASKQGRVGFGLVPFDIVAQWEPLGGEGSILSVRIIGCRIKGTSIKSAPGGDATVIEMPLAVSRIEWLASDGTVLRMV